MAVRIVRLGTPRSMLSRETDFAVGCYCENEARRHRSVLRRLLVERGAKLKR